MDNTGIRRPRVEGKSDSEIASLAYSTVEGIEFTEPNDGNRLGYHVFRYLMGEISTLDAAITEAKARTPLGAAEIERRVRERLNAAGVHAG